MKIGFTIGESFMMDLFHGASETKLQWALTLLWERFPSQDPVALGMNPGTPVSTTALNLIRDLIPSLISRMAS